MSSPIPRLRTPNFPGQDLVNKFIAATPSYMYTPIVGQHSFYFSELLRSLSQAKKAEMINLSREAAAQQQQQLQTRKAPRKRTWRPNESQDDTLKSERPLELTSKNSAFSPKMPDKKADSPSDAKHFRVDEKISEKSEGDESDANSSQENLCLPPPPPVWYPPLYPYSGIDPANFFVDLRVSGHIFERKRELAAQALKTVTNNNNNNLPSYFDNDLNKNRIGSAFSVPKSRELKVTAAETEDLVDEKPTKKFYDNGVTVYNIDSDEDGCRKMEQEDSDEDETIAVDEN